VKSILVSGLGVPASIDPLALDDAEDGRRSCCCCCCSISISISSVGSIWDSFLSAMTDPLAPDSVTSDENEADEEKLGGVAAVVKASLAAKGSTDGSRTRLATAARSSLSTCFLFSCGINIRATCDTPEYSLSMTTTPSLMVVVDGEWGSDE
jgi:hypothetical protein